jgi:hypothetical protein
VLSLANWLLLIASAALWTKQGLKWWRDRHCPWATNDLLLWAYYGAFALQCAAGIVVDVSGALASNVQLRAFPSFALMAAPLVAKYLVDARPKSMLVRRVGNAWLWLGLGVLALLSTLKATSEPLLSNKWFFYTPGEMRALDWAEDALPKQGLWLEFDERLFAAARIRNGASPLDVYPDWEDVDPGTLDFLISDVTHSRSARLAQPLPIDADSFITYDNGQAQIYHRRPRTPYQP